MVLHLGVNRDRTVAPAKPLQFTTDLGIVCHPSCRPIQILAPRMAPDAAPNLILRILSSLAVNMALDANRHLMLNTQLSLAPEKDLPLKLHQDST